MNNPKQPRKLLIVDDDRLFCDLVREDLGSPALEVVIANHVAEAGKVSRTQKFDVVLLDNNLPDGNGLDLIPDILRFNEQTKIILITAFPSYDNAVAALKNGVFDYLPKPLDIDELQVTVERALRTAALEQVEQIERYKAGQESAASVLLGAGAEFEELQNLIEKAARSSAPVLITGDTGTGKNVVAQAIHYRADSSSRKTFVSVNCAALPEHLIEAELFGAEKGAYTGAVATRKGIFEIADGGTLFLDEIGEMPFPLQSKLLSVLEDGKVRRIGGDATRSVNVRVIAATNAAIDEAISEKRFRSDLFYRLSVIRIHLCPLRERKQDIPALCRMFVSKFAPGGNIILPAEELELLAEYDYPGNVRELRNIIERCVILQEGNTIHPSKLIFSADNGSASSSDPFTVTPAASDKNAGGKSILTLEEVERDYITATLEKFSNNFSRSAKALDISLSTLKRKLREYGIR